MEATANDPLEIPGWKVHDCPLQLSVPSLVYPDSRPESQYNGCRPEPKIAHPPLSGSGSTVFGSPAISHVGSRLWLLPA
jgi:hypothetical protein